MMKSWRKIEKLAKNVQKMMETYQKLKTQLELNMDHIENLERELRSLRIIAEFADMPLGA